MKQRRNSGGRTKFKVKHQQDKNMCKGHATKCASNYNICRNPIIRCAIILSFLMRSNDITMNMNASKTKLMLK
jgi:hypothetical protein